MLKLMEYIGSRTIAILEEMGRIIMLLSSAVFWMFRRPFRFGLLFKQMEFVGVNSTLVVVLTGGFTGGVLAMQTYYGFRKFGAESLVGATVALSLTRELGPVLTGLMVTGRVGSSMAAELGTMRVTEQIDAMYTMAVDPVKNLVLPRILAAILMLPVLTVVCNFVGVIGGYLVGVKLLGINSGIFLSKMYEIVKLDDIYNGLYKSIVFGLILALVGCYKGFYTKGGAAGVGRATTSAVVLSSVLILIFDYILTSFMF
ncbi:MlaE family ABC transporter permease [Thermodesulfobacteriota bacterium]